jgi:multiple sugar transport system substrate-binding protein
MKSILAFVLTAGILLCSGLTGCSHEFGLDPKNPVTLTLWHNYGGVMRSTMDELLDTFNSTVGKEKGIIIDCTSINSSAALQEKLLIAAKGDPGAPELPDITTCYPKVAITLAEKGLLADLNQYFGKEEIAQYVTSFVDEGKIGDKLYVFPIAKSTEVLFLNQTLFDRFSKATGVTTESLSTFEGIAQAAMAYYQWTDDQTPEVQNDGKAFIAVDSSFNLMQVGMEQLGNCFVENQQPVTSGDTYGHIYETLFEAAVKGGYAIYDGYSSDLSKTGDIICSIGSTAGILFYGDSITYENNITEAVEYSVFPYPVFENGKPIAIQRGSGMSVAKSDPKKEYAASVFLKWFTEADQNMKFISETGYLPVTNSAFGTVMENEARSVDNNNIRKLLKVAISMHKEYEFYIPPVFDAFDSLGREWESNFKSAMRAAREEYLTLLETTGSNEAYRRVQGK